MNKAFDTIGRFIIKYAKMNIALILCLTIFFVFGITKIEMRMGNDVFLSNTSDVYKDTETYQKHFGGDGIYVLLSGESDTLLSQETNKAIVEFTKKAEDIKDITGSTHYVGLLNEMLSAPAPSFSAFDTGETNLKLETALKNSIPSEKMNATIRAEGFDDKTIEVELTANETTRIRVYLMPSEGNLNYYAKNSDEAEKLATFNDEWVQKMTRLLAIQEILPITDFKYGGLNGKSSEIVINEISDCKAYLCLQAIGNFDTESQVDDLIVAKGFNPKDYEIKYEKR